MSDKITFSIHELVSALDTAADAMLTERYGVTANQFVFLATCADVEPTDITGLAECLRISKAAVSKRVPGLVRDGWLTTRDDPAHGRRVILELTDRARDLVERAGRDLDAQFTALFTDPRARGIDAALLNDHLNVLTALLRENAAS